MHKTAKKRPAKKRIEESRAAEATTVFWMLTMLATLGAEILALAGWAWLALFSARQESDTAIQSLPTLLLTTAGLTGLICLLLIPLVYKLRQSPPPKAMTLFTVLISITPMLLLLLHWLLGRS